MNALAQAVANLGAFRLASIVGVGLGLVAFFIFLASRLAGPGGMVLLYGDLDPSESGKIVSTLEAQQIPYELKAGGAQIYVPNNAVLKLRITLAEAGLPSGGTVGYEIFDDTDTLGTTSFVQNLNRLRALEGELVRTIISISNIDNARVHIVMPQRQLFSREMQEPSASVVLKLSNRSRFSQPQVRAIQNLVATSVPGLKTSRISIIDDSGNLLARGGEETVDGMTPFSDVEETQRAYEQHLAHTIESLLEKSVGFGNVRAEVNADMDFDRITINSEEYDPEGQVVRSTQTVEENATNLENQETEGAVTVGANLPGALGGEGEGGSAKSASKSSRIEETVNYEISRISKSHIREVGVVKRLSVAVLVDGTYTKDANGDQVYQSRPPEDLADYEKLVRSIVGFNEGRGDTVEVVNLQFTIVEEEFAEEVIEPLFGLHKQDYFRIAEILIFSIVGVLVIFMVVRPLLMRALEALPPPSALIEREGMITDQIAPGAAPAALTGPESAVAAAAGTVPIPSAAPLAEEAEALIDIRQIEGRVKGSSLKKIGEIIEKHPEETVSIIRNWMFQEK